MFYISTMPSVLMPPTQFGLRPWYPREHPCVQNQSDDSQCYSRLQALVRDTGFEHDCVYSICQTLMNVKLLCKA